MRERKAATFLKGYSFTLGVKNVMRVGCRPNYNLKLNARITTLLELVPSSAMVYCTLNNSQHKMRMVKNRRKGTMARWGLNGGTEGHLSGAPNTVVI